MEDSVACPNVFEGRNRREDDEMIMGDGRIGYWAEAVSPGDNVKSDCQFRINLLEQGAVDI